MATNPLAADKTRVVFQLTHTEKAKLEALAKHSGMSISEYVRACLRPHMQTESTFRLVSEPHAIYRTRGRDYDEADRILRSAVDADQKETEEQKKA